jgi:hypothetical protein
MKYYTPICCAERAGEYVLTMAVLFSPCYDPILIDRVSVLMG